MTIRKALEKIPEHLLPFITTQDPSLYTPIDHASWRYIMRLSKAYFAKYAHQKYLDGLKETGISTERIPLIEEMDEKLRRFGWRAVAVSGFIPPAVFIEFQSLGILPIACDMRTLEHMAYTPAPDIVHEAAGHAPIVADPEYAQYLLNYGEVARRAIYSHHDLSIYEAIRTLSDVKEDPKSTQVEIDESQRRLDAAVAACDFVSEATQLARMSWWTVEYGLVGDMDHPKIYGAGLLSSVGESFSCLRSDVKKIPFSVDCIKTTYDITKPQPQLFVTPDFGKLTTALDEMAELLAYKRGGVEALEKGKTARALTSTVLDTGIQITGVLTEYVLNEAKEPIFVKYSGPVQLAHSDRELTGQGPQHHPEGFSTPLGQVAGSHRSIADLAVPDFQHMGFSPQRKGKLMFESGIEVEGVLKGIVQRSNRNILLSFEDCTVKRGDVILFRPEWGSFDMACGEKVVSVFGGAADRGKYVNAIGGFQQKPRFPKTNLTEENRALNELYARVRKIRDAQSANVATELARVHEELELLDPKDWLLRMELLELNSSLQLSAPWVAQIRDRLSEISKSAEDKAELISRGMELL